jgi:hypothetical protein
MTAAIQVACTETPHGPCRVRTGMASRVNPASQPKTTTAQTMPRASVRPTPWTRAAPPVTTRAAATRYGRGREPSSSGPITASSEGTLATATPSTAGSARVDPSTSAMLNTTRPVTAIPDSQSHSAPRGRLSRRPVTRASRTSSRQAAAYRTASAVKTGARTRTEETATLPPTQTMAEAPAATPVTGPRREADGTVTPVSGSGAGGAWGA